MAMNTSKVLVGGLVAGIVGNVLGFLLFGLWLGPTFEREVAAAAPSLAEKAAGGMGMATPIISSFVVGILLVWLYAAMRPRFGPGPKTAIYAALVVVVLGFLFHMDLWVLGLTSPATYMLATLAALIQTVGASWVGAMLYKEEGAPAM
ncbi:MAG: hypothetical protein ACRENU_11430 [Gemmatimonadaceae bacterium]